MTGGNHSVGKMGPIHCIYLYIVLSIAASEPIAKEYVFDALRCNDLRTSATYSGRKFCDRQIIENEYGLSNRAPSGKYTLVQQTTTRKFRGVKCAKKISTITAICGAFSHSKLVTPPDVLMPVSMTAKECMEIIQTQFATTEDQRQVRVPMGSRVMYKYISTGTVTMSDTNVACEGGELKVQGKRHENLVKLVTVDLVVTEIDVWENQGRLKTDEGMLPRQCSLAFEGCTLEDMTLVLDLSKINLCKYKSIRTVEFDALTWAGQHMLVNDEHKILLSVKDKTGIPGDCMLQGTLIKTNFEWLFLIMGEIEQGIDLIDPTNLDLELETRVTDFYMSYWTMTLHHESEAKWQGKLCDIATTQMGEDQMILHEDHLLKLQGELIIEFPCSKVKVRTRENHKVEGDSCLDHLPVYLPDDSIGYLTPITRVLVPRSAVSIVNCSTHYPYVYESVNGKLVTANPAVKEVTVNLNDYHHLDSSSRNHTEMFEFSSLLYTKEEIQLYESLLMGHSSERAISKKFTSYYCQTTGECTPSRIAQDFQWNKLMEPEEMLEYYYQKLKEKLIWWAIWWSVIDSAFTLFQIGVKLVLVCRNIGRKRLTSGTILRFMFLPGQELIRLFPREEGHEMESHRQEEECGVAGCEGARLQRVEDVEV